MGITYRSAKLPANPVGLYWPYWSPGTRLINMPSQYNVFIYFHCTNPGGGISTTGTVDFKNVSGIPLATVAADFATVRAQGKRVLLSVGGAGAQVYVNSLANANNLINSIKSINEQLGGSGTTAAIDGIDWNNYEGVTDANFRQWMTYAGQQLKAYYGQDFIISSPPAGYDIGGPNTTADRLLLASLYVGNALDWFSPQFYDPSNLNTLANKRSALDFYNSAVTVNGQSVTIPKNHIGVGMGLNYAGAALTAYETAADARADFLQLIADGRAPKGGFLWAASLGTYPEFASTVAPVMNNYANEEPPPAFEVDTVTSTNFVDGANTSFQLIPPAGKTTANFTTGKMSESSNPMTGVDIGNGGYTELEWCLQATTDAVDGDIFEFRVTYNGTPLDGYDIYPRWTVGTPPAPADTTAPSVPTNLQATAVSQSQINLTWTASTDNVGVTGYRVRRNGTQIATTATNSYQSTGLSPSTLYSYTVSAYDAATNESAQSSAATATTDSPPADTTPPTVTITAPADGATVSGTSVSITATASDDTAVAGVQFKIDGVNLGSEDTTAPYSVIWDSSTATNGSHTITAVARDTSNNTTSDVNVVVTVNGGQEPPTGQREATGVASMTGVSVITF